MEIPNQWMTNTEKLYLSFVLVNFSTILVYIALFCYFTKLILVHHGSAYRTPICKSKRGGFKDTYPEDLLATVLKV